MNPDQRFDPTSHYAIQETPPGADTIHVKRKYLDIPYADLSPSQKLDIYLPDEGNGPFPVIVSLHGGAFIGCDKADMAGYFWSFARVDHARVGIYSRWVTVSF